MENLKDYLHERVVLTTKNEVCYAGIPYKTITIGDQNGLMVRIDENSNFSIWCPENFIKEILVIPIPEEIEV